MAFTASKFAKSLQKADVLASEPLTPAEIKVLTADFPPPHKSLRLGTQKEIRWEMRRVYEATIRAQLPLTAATKLIYMLEKIARSKSDEEKLKVLERGGIAGAPFIGLILEGPTH